MDRATYEEQTVADLREELKARGLDTSGNKPELVDRLVGDDFEREQAKTKSELADELRERGEPISGTKSELVERVVETEPELSGKREQHVVEAGGHQILVDDEPATPEPMDTCAVCGAVLGTCVHSQEAYGRTWDIAQPTPVPPASDTHWPDETVGPRSLVGDDTPSPDVAAASADRSEEE